MPELMLATVALMLLAWQEPEVPLAGSAGRSAIDDLGGAIGAARRSLGQAMAALRAGDSTTARAEVDRVVELLAAVPLDGGSDEVLDLLWQTGSLALDTGNVAAAQEVWSRVLQHCETTLPEGHGDLIAARGNLALALVQAGDLEGARILQEAVLVAVESTLPESHPKRLMACLHLANTVKLMGDLEQARALEEFVVAGRERTLAEDDPSLLAARMNLAATIKSLGDVAGAREVEEVVLAAYERVLPANHRDLLAARVNLGTSLCAMGDIPGGRALFESAVAGFERILPPDHPQLLLARQNLAGARKAMGDVIGARALLEDVLAKCERSLPETHPQLLGVRLNLAATRSRMGDLAGARALEESVLAVYERTLPANHPDLIGARQNLAYTLGRMGDRSGARALREALVEDLESTLQSDHPSLLRARLNLAASLSLAGDLPEALELQEAVLAARERTLPEDHRLVLDVRQGLAVTLRRMGERERARSVGLELAKGMILRLERAFALAPREARELASAEAERYPVVRMLIDSENSETVDSILFELSATLRSLSTSSYGLAAVSEARRQELTEIRARLNDLVGGDPDASWTPETFAAEVSRLVSERDRIEREIRAELADRGFRARAIRASEVASSLPARSAAVAFLRHGSWSQGPEPSSIEWAGETLVAQVLLPDGSLTELELGPAEELDELSRNWRAALGSPVLSRGLGLPPSKGDGKGELPAGRALRERVLDPVLAVVGDARQLFVCLDDFLYTVPLEALPLDENEDQRAGDEVRIVSEASFVQLLEHEATNTGEPGALLVGDVAYDGNSLGLPGSFPAPIEDPRSDVTASFPALPATRKEVISIAERFRETFERDGVLLRGNEATKVAFHELAPGKRFVQICTHGWFALESVSSWNDASPGDDGLVSPMQIRDTLAGLAPLTLCGLAFAGANHGRDPLGRVPGIMTAEELAGIDLSACELAVLSACETNVGIRRAGQGIQSLQTALHAAGARASITSLWKVEDARTRLLMERFYTYLWEEELSKSEALWKAKCDLRSEGAPVRDWAAWVLSGDPR